MVEEDKTPERDDTEVGSVPHELISCVLLPKFAILLGFIEFSNLLRPH